MELVPRLLLGMVALFAGVAALAYLFRDPIVAFSTWLIDTLGWPGLTLSFALTDVMPVASHTAVLVIGHAGGLTFWPAFLAASLGAMLGVVGGWSVGRLFSRNRWLNALLERYRISPFLRRYGVAAVAIASLTPVPDSLCVIGTGAAGLPLWQPLLGASVRIPKNFIYLLIIQAGWSIGS